MNLQQLEISGFKSFPDRSELRFDNRVTAIVGPNGCGKSNLVDAITWVLGEQSAKSLRGDRMEDVIFSGSDARKPTAAAEVKLLLTGVTAQIAGNGHPRANGDRNGDRPALALEASGVESVTLAPAATAVREVEDDDALDVIEIARNVEVSRRLYRSGESEYLIDGRLCRLRDVQDLLMDSGVGIKAYAVIEQGKIGQILSARPGDRRLLIEEAAGVTKYKSRRRSAELKLEAAQQNLTRIDDIVFEVEKQRAALKRQAAKARRYRRLRDELRQWEKVSFTRRYRALATVIEAARARLAETRARDQAASTQLAELENRQARLRLELTEADARATSTREAAHARELEIGKLQQQIAFDKQQVAELATAGAQLAAQLESLHARRGPAQTELESRRSTSAAADRERDAAGSSTETQLRAYAVTRQELEGLESDVEAARSEVFAAINAATALRHAVEHASEARERIGAERSKLEVEVAEVRGELAKARSDLDTARQSVDETHGAVEATRAARATAATKLADLVREREVCETELRARQHELAGTAARLTSLEEMEAARAGYDDAARRVLAEAGDRLRHRGSVADHVEVEQRYERAVEAVVGDLLQCVVVERRQDAAVGLELVREAGGGRCGFLVQEGARERPAVEPPAALAVTPLSQVVRAHGDCAAAIHEALGRVWVADTFAVAADAAERTGDRVVSLEGVVFEGPRRVSGGGGRASRGILGTRREVKELGDRVAADRAAIAELAAGLVAFDERIASAQAMVAGLDQEERTHEKTLVSWQGRLERAAAEVDRLDRKQQLIEVEHRRAAEEIAGLEARQAEARESIVRLEADQHAADERFAGAQRRLFEAKEAAESLGTRLADARAEHAALVERAAALAAEVGRLESAAAELEARIAASSEEQARTRDRREALIQRVAESEGTLDAVIRSFEQARLEVREVDELATQLRADYETHEQEIRDARGALEEIRSALGQLEVSQATAEADLAHLGEACQEVVQLGIDEVIAEVEQLEREGALDLDTTLASDETDGADDTTEDPSTATSEGPEGDEASTFDVAPERPATVDDLVARLKEKIERLGPVNMMAVEQFDELESRHSFLSTQRQDLIDSIGATADAIKRIDRTTRERFREAFEAINLHFQQTFATLFGGGQAGLVLLDESDLLETGVDIIAQPPGKRLQSVQLLSGGEKALTAMALMFAIFKYKPSPFCILDEIDAPLDDANIARFVEMLRGMETHTQFVLITHNRKTMEIADRLYGVTMEEPGVSKLISVELN